MGKKLDPILGRGFRASKFKALLKLILSRVAVLQNRHKVKQAIREQNMLDVYAMVEGYCSLLAERVDLFEREKLCPKVLKEAMSSLIFAASQCRELPELQEVRRSLASCYGQDFAVQAIDIMNGYAVSSKIIQKLSARQPPLETRTKLIMEIALENGIAIPLEDHPVIDQ